MVHFSPVGRDIDPPQAVPACPRREVHPICSRNIHVPISWFWNAVLNLPITKHFAQTSNHRNNKTMYLHEFHVNFPFLSFCCWTQLHMPICLHTIFTFPTMISSNSICTLASLPRPTYFKSQLKHCFTRLIFCCPTQP